jgi:hypothetical protein
MSYPGLFDKKNYYKSIFKRESEWKFYYISDYFLAKNYVARLKYIIDSTSKMVPYVVLELKMGVVLEEGVSVVWSGEYDGKDPDETIKALELKILFS